jgi:hypothetical protein
MSTPNWDMLSSIPRGVPWAHWHPLVGKFPLRSDLLNVSASSSEDVVVVQSLLGNAEEGFMLAEFQVLYVDTPEFNPPEGEELSSWLVSQNHVWPEDMPDEPNLVIDGIPAVRVYHQWREQNAEEIYVIRNGRLISILMQYVDVEENLELYENILATLRFID